MLDYLHQVAPTAKVDWVVEEQFADLLSGNPLLHQLHVIRTRAWRKQLLNRATRHEVSTLWRKLREQDYDLVFDIQGNLKSGLVAWATGCGQRLGFAREHLQESINTLFTTRKIPMRKEDNYSSGRCLRIVSIPFGKDYSGMELQSDIHTPPEADAVAEQLIRECGNGPVFLFHCGTTWQTKFWSEEGWCQLGHSINAAYGDATMLLSWGNDNERDMAGRIAANIGPKARLLEKLPIKGIAAIIKKVDVVIGGDTGLIHLAAAVGTPTVSYYRASDGSVSGPRGSDHVIVQSHLPCSRCQRTKCDKDAECRASIAPGAIFSGIQEIMQGYEHNN